MRRSRRTILAFGPLLLCAAAAVNPAELSADERAVAAFVDEHHEEAIALLARIVDVNSGTLNPAGVRAVGEILAAELDALGLEIWWVDMSAVDRGPHLFARTRGSRDRGKSVLLIGHLDTVFEPDSEFQRFVRSGSTATGPGAADMKGGNVAIVQAMKALAAADALDGADITVAFLGDEESPGEPVSISRRDLIEAGRRVDVALGFETGVTRDGVEYVTVARRSWSGWRLEVTGKQAHSSGIFSEGTGAGAVFETARILAAFYESVRGEEYLTFNAGTILGGTDVDYDAENTRGTVSGKVNIVPRRVVVDGGIRTVSAEQLERARAQMRQIVAESLPVTSAEITFEDSYPPMAPTEGNRELMEMYVEASVDLGLGTLEELDPGRRGAADISFVAPYVDGLAGLGLYGRGAHGPEETVDLDSLAVATKRAAVLIHRLTR